MFLSFLVVLVLFFVSGIVFRFICEYATKYHKTWKKKFDDAREFIYRYSIVWSLFFLMIGLTLWVLTYYIGDPTVLAAFSVIIVIVLAFFISCIEGIIFYFGYSCFKRNNIEIDKQKKVISKNNTYFMMFFIGSITLLSYPLLSLAKVITSILFPH